MSACPSPARAAFCLVAIAVLVLALPARADDAAAVRNLLARGELPAALQGAERALAARPQDAQLRFLLGVVLMDMGQDNRALALFTQLSQQYPELPDPMNNIALLQARAGQLELARQSLEVALRNDPGHRKARINLGQVHLMLAVQAWTQVADAVATDPDTELLRKLLGARALLAPPTR